jgi:hypothetical protein
MRTPRPGRRKSESLHGKSAESDSDRRDQFLMVMYGKMWDNINRHLTVVWQSSAILAGATAVFALVEKGALSLDIASTLIVLISGWLVLHAYDANSWYNRNLGIIANIERQFLDADDAHDIHYFFERHREPGLVEHLQIHAILGIGFAALTLAYHVSVRVWPGRNAPIENFEPQRLLPYLTLVGVGGLIARFRSHYRDGYKTFEERSPGKGVPGVGRGGDQGLVSGTAMQNGPG